MTHFTLSPKFTTVPSAKRRGGFTLIEVAVVLVIVGLLLGSIMMPMVTQQELRKTRDTERQIAEVIDALMGFAASNGRLPCPATNASNGQAAPNNATTACTSFHGFVPARTLGLTGGIDANNRLIDSWDNPLRYSLTNANTGAYPNDIVLGLAPDFRVCEQSACTSVIADNVVAVVFSTGSDGATATTSPDQLENTDGDITFVQRTLTEGTGTEFDDLVNWISPNTLVFHLVKSGQLN